MAGPEGLVDLVVCSDELKAHRWSRREVEPADLVGLQEAAESRLRVVLVTPVLDDEG